MAVKLGLRLQIVLSLGGLLLCAFVPLFYAVATYTQVALRQIRHEHARQLGRAIAGHLTEAREQRSQEELLSLLKAQAGTQGVEAIGVYDQNGLPIAQVGRRSLVETLGKNLNTSQEALLELEAEHGTALAVVVPGASGAVAAILRVDDQSARIAPLVRLVGLYTGVVALATLLLAYFALTRLIVRPLDHLTRGARRVASGRRQLDVPRSGARELVELGQSLCTMTERLLAEEQALRRKIDEVELATRKLKAAQDTVVRSERLASVGRLAAGLAHEVGNPLAALMGLEDLLLDGGLEPGQQQDFLKRMRKETERIHRIVRDLLAFARPSGVLEGEVHEPGDVALGVSETLTLLKPQKSLAEVELEVELEESLPRVPLSTAEIVQIVLNLVLNAADACQAGGHVSVRASHDAGRVRLVVEDDGPGVPDSIAATLFEPFVTTKDVGKGTGLGLAVCRGLIDSVGGSIQLDTEFRGGARFVVELPKAIV